MSIKRMHSDSPTLRRSFLTMQHWAAGDLRRYVSRVTQRKWTSLIVSEHCQYHTLGGESERI